MLEKKEKNFRREGLIRQAVKKMQNAGFNFVFEETPDTYIVKFKDQNNKDRVFHFMKMDGTLPIGNKRCKIEDVIKAVLMFPDDPISEALLKSYQKED